MKRTVFDVANWFLSKESMTPKKLQKLVYYAYSWYLTLVNESKDDLTAKLFTSRLEAWVHGPVFPELYQKYKGYSSIDEVRDMNIDGVSRRSIRASRKFLKSSCTNRPEII